LPASLIKTFPILSIASPPICVLKAISAAAAGPLSPKKPVVVLPANVVIIPLAIATFRIREVSGKLGFP
jgi:hypothetical protein